MPDGNAVFKELEPSGPVPESLKFALVAEMDAIRNTMQVVKHFTEYMLVAVTVCLSLADHEEPND